MSSGVRTRLRARKHVPSAARTQLRVYERASCLRAHTHVISDSTTRVFGRTWAPWHGHLRARARTLLLGMCTFFGHVYTQFRACTLVFSCAHTRPSCVQTRLRAHTYLRACTRVFIHMHVSSCRRTRLFWWLHASSVVSTRFQVNACASSGARTRIFGCVGMQIFARTFSVAPSNGFDYVHAWLCASTHAFSGMHTHLRALACAPSVGRNCILERACSSSSARMCMLEHVHQQMWMRADVIQARAQVS